MELHDACRFPASLPRGVKVWMASATNGCAYVLVNNGAHHFSRKMTLMICDRDVFAFVFLFEVIGPGAHLGYDLILIVLTTR